MGLWDIILIGVGLSMDAAAVSMSNGLCMEKVRAKTAFLIALFFGAFQGMMPMIGYFAGTTFSNLISSVDHWVAFGLLTIIGGKMIYDCLQPEEEKGCHFITVRLLAVQAVATSIDALAVGVGFAVSNVSVWKACGIIAATTFLISLASVYIGHRFGSKLKTKAEFLGGAILVVIGIKILIEHLFF